MRIPENQIDEILEKASIVDVVSRYVRLKKRGRNYLGVCPFHNEKTPSFTVSEDKQIFHCFGCKAGGNVFKFMMDIEKFSFVEAVEAVAKEVGYTIVYEKYKDNTEKPETEILYEICSETAIFFADSLQNSNEAFEARKYFERRGLKQATIRAFNLGYAPSGEKGVQRFFKTSKIGIEKPIELGILGKNDNGNIYDRFGGRIIFPLYSTHGRVIGFAGRIMEKSEYAAKYVNSPESTIYQKGKTLYGFWLAKDEIRKLDYAIIVEGYMDLISLHQAGVKNVVAVSGTALTDSQIALIHRLTQNVVLFFDSDSAGVKASLRSIELLLKQDMNIRIGSLPKGEDPDSFVTENGKDAFMQVVQKSGNFLDFQVEVYTESGKLNDPITAADSIREILKPLASMKDELKRELLLKNAAKKFDLSESMLFRELKVAIQDNVKVQNKEYERESRRIVREFKPVAEAEVAVTQKIPQPIAVNERELIKLLFEGNGEIYNFIFYFVRPDELYDSRNLAIFEAVESLFEPGKPVNIEKVYSTLETESLKSYARELSFVKHTTGDKIEAILPSRDKTLYARMCFDVVEKFKVLRINQEIQNVMSDLAKAVSDDTKDKMMLALHRLQQEKKDIFKNFETIRKESLT